MPTSVRRLNAALAFVNDELTPALNEVRNARTAAAVDRVLRTATPAMAAAGATPPAIRSAAEALALPPAPLALPPARSLVVTFETVRSTS